MGLTKRGKDWCIEFPVIDDGKTLKLAPYGSRSLPGFKMKRWKAGRYKEQAERIEVQKRQELETGLVRSENLPGPVTFKALTEGYLTLTAHQGAVRLHAQESVDRTEVPALLW